MTDFSKILDKAKELESKMKEAAKKLNFEDAANLRDRIKHMRQKLSGKDLTSGT